MSIGVLLLAGFALGGFLVARRSTLSLAALFAGGLAIPAALYLLAYLTADDERGQCSDCALYLGRYWEPWLVGVVAGILLVAYWLGILLGRVLRRR